MNYVASVNTLRSWSTVILTLALWSSAGCARTIAAREGAPETSCDMPKQSTIELSKGRKMKLTLIPAGTFMMGAELSMEETIRRHGGKPQHLSCEHPRHEVTISKPFYMGIYEVTKGEWTAVMGTEPWKDRFPPAKLGDDYPANWVHALQAIEFCEKLSKQTGRKVSLPTEAQWEYACRAGTTTAWSFGNDQSQLVDHAWCWLNTRNAKPPEAYAHLVGQKKPNPWGLYDIHGNLWEFCGDRCDKDFYARSPKADPQNTEDTKGTKLRAIRGGSWHNGTREARCAMRNTWTGDNYVHYNYGFRVVVQP
jgi:formylglycine-generating enzyme required for sulfatase activity